MKTRFNKILTVITAVTFVAVFAINIQASFNDPFAGMSDAAIAQSTTGSTSETTGGAPCDQCVVTKKVGFVTITLFSCRSIEENESCSTENGGVTLTCANAEEC